MTENQVPVVLQSFALVSPARVREVLQANLGSEALTRFDLAHIRVPGPGSSAWEIPTADGPKPVREFDMIIVYVKPARRWYKESWKPGMHQPPDCYSDDLIEGVGDPGGLCVDCPHNAWGTAVNAKGEQTRGKACGEYRLLVGKLREGGLLPVVVVIPPSSLKAVKAYLLDLSNWPPYYGHTDVVTRLTLEKGDPICTVKPARKEVLPLEAQAIVKAFAEDMKHLLGAVVLSEEDIQQNA